jgi:hypothetical protein
MEFFNFGNSTTYHVFKWLTESGHVDPDGLIAAAMAKVEGDPWFEMGVSVSEVTRDKLADDLEDVVLNLAAAWAPVDFDSAEPGDVQVFDDAGDALFGAILHMAVAEIWYHPLAEALLIRARKWAPDRSRPEIL